MTTRTLSFVLVFAAIASLSSAQERTAATPFNNNTDITNAAMLSRVSYQTQLISTLQDQLRTCIAEGKAAGAGDGGDIADYSERERLLNKISQQQATIAQLESQIGKARTAEDISDNDQITTTTVNNIRPTAQPAQSGLAASGASQPRRPVGVYQQPAEPKLSCADYSLYYFKRHPAMAAVCGVTGRIQPQPAQTAPETPAPVSATTPEVSATRPVSATTRLPQRP